MRKAFLFIRIYLFLGLIISPLIGFSQLIDQANINEYTIKDGLSLSYITTVFQDKNDFIWVGTQDGLNRFNGSKFTFFRHNASNPFSIPGNYIRSMAQEHNGNLWIATENAVCIFEQSTSAFYVIMDSHSDNYQMVSDIIVNDSSVYLNASNGIFKIRKSDYAIQYFEHFNDPFNFECNTCLNQLIELDPHLLLIASKDGLFLFNKDSESFSRFTHKKNNVNSLPTNSTISLYMINKDSVLIGTTYGLSLFNPQKYTFKNFLLTDNELKLFNYRNIINSIKRDQEGFFWLGTKMGILIFDLHTGVFSTALDYNPAISKIQDKEINALLLDKTNSLWVATAGSNLFSISRNKSFFKKLNHYTKTPAYEIRGVYLSSNNLLFVGTNNNGLFVYNDKKELFRYFSPDNSVLKSFSILSMAELPDQNVVLGTSEGLYLYNIQSNKIEFFSENWKHLPKFIFQNNRIFDIEITNKNHFWLATENGLIYASESDFKAFYSSQNDSSSLSNNICYTLEIDSSGHLWVGTLHGLNKLIDFEKGTFKHYFEDRTNKGLPNNSILSIYQENAHTLWIGTESGLAKFNMQADTFKHYTVNDGLLNDFVYSVFTDKYNRVWFSTNNGVSRLTPQTSEIFHFGKSDGLQDYEFNLCAGHKDKNGIIYFGGNSGLNFFNPDSSFVQENVRQVKIYSIIVTQNGRQEEIIVYDQKEFAFFYKGLHIQLNFVVPDYNSIGNYAYQYRMLGIDDKWVNLGKRNTVSFSQLPVGEYIFHVKGANNHGVWNKETTSVKIIIKPAFYNSRVAIFTYLFFGISFILMSVFFVTSRLRKENSLLKQKERDARKIALQKEELQQQNLNIRSSMEYAQRIIYAMMPSVDDFKKILPESFIIYEPKDIVSGDFYWIAQRNGLVYFAMVDCTGHGIPGAFMSIIGFDILRNVVNKMHFTEPADILSHLSMDLVEVLTKESSSKESLQDGMDMSVCVLDTSNNTLKFAGAYNPLYLVRNNNIIEYKADRYSVGASGIASGHKFSTKIIQLQPDDIIYLFSDGYTDQFGGPENKKFKHRRFRHLLLSVHKHPLQMQKKAIWNAHQAWKKGLEQVDDILIMGIKPYCINIK
jgi:serine phosphatase RsbU (regulator of sigma subunit)